MVVGYANDSSRFDGSLEQFARFLGRITWPSSPTAPSDAKPASKPDAQPWLSLEAPRPEPTHARDVSGAD